MKFISAVKENKKLNPLSLEYFDKRSLDFLKKDFPNIQDDSPVALYIENEEKGDSLRNWANLVENYPIIDTWVSQDKRSYEQLINFRHKLPENINEYFKRIKSKKLALDIAVPEGSFKELFDFYHNIRLNNRNIETVLFGHIGENHLHFNFFPRDEKEKELADEILIQAIKKGINLGGTISAEHGIGKFKHRYLEMMYGKKGVAEMVRIKKQLDHYCIFGLDNIFPRERLER